jgi:ubiquinone/menaquinone biosynthesis C-methylase UbiE
VKILFDERVAQVYDRWFEMKKRLLVDSLEKELILKIADLKRGESILEVGCGTGHYLQFFSKTRMKTMGVDLSLPMLRSAQKKMREKNGLCLGKAEELPFKTESFDAVSLITTLEFVEDPQKALREAIRVSRDKILLGVLNKYSLTAIGRRIKGIFRQTIYNEANFYSIWELKKLLTQVLRGFSLKWGSVLTLPLNLRQRFGSVEGILSFRKNPF